MTLEEYNNFDSHKGEFLFQHFVGCSGRSSELAYTLSRLEKSLKEHYQLREMEIPDTEERLRWGLTRFLAAAAKKYSNSRIVIVIDGVNKMQSESAQVRFIIKLVIQFLII